MEFHTPGIVYLSTIPTNMRTRKVREIFSEFGEVRRVFLAPDPNHKKKGFFKEGWVEFAQKKNAKRAVHELDMTIVSNRRRSRWSDQFWTLRYLSKFSWEQLNETVLLPSRRLQEGIKEARREANKYKDLSTAAASKRQKRRPKKSAAKLQTAILPSQEPGKSSEPPKKKKQKSLKTTEEAGENGVAKNESARGFNNDVLSSIFTS